jgi:hypothetical protein
MIPFADLEDVRAWLDHMASPHGRNDEQYERYVAWIAATLRVLEAAQRGGRRRSPRPASICAVRLNPAHRPHRGQ